MGEHREFTSYIVSQMCDPRGVGGSRGLGQKIRWGGICRNESAKMKDGAPARGVLSTVMSKRDINGGAIIDHETPFERRIVAVEK